MDGEITWKRPEYEPRLEAHADDVSEFVDAILQSIDYEGARAAPRLWRIVCQFFQGCGLGSGFKIAFDESTIQSDEESQIFSRNVIYFEGYSEYMDWLSNPQQFHPTRLRPPLEQARLGDVAD